MRNLIATLPRAVAESLLAIAIASLIAAGVSAIAISYAQATMKSAHPEHSYTMKSWFKSAAPTDAARKAYGWPTFNCCEVADRVRVKFVPGRDADEWGFRCPTEEDEELAAKYCAQIEKKPGDWVLIPAEIVHHDQAVPPKGYEGEENPKIHAEFELLRREGVLFIANIGGTLRQVCFWPPQEED